MAIRLNLNHDGLKHRFVKLLEVKVTADGTDVAQVSGGRKPSKPGALKFDVPETAKRVQLTCTIPAQTPRAIRQKLAILNVVQNFKVVTDPAPPHLEPEPNFHGRYHARLIETGGTAVSKAGRSRVLNLRLDVTFLNVTEHAQDKGRFGLLTPDGNPFGSQFAPFACRFRLMEYTRGEPSVWVVLVPPAITFDKAKINVFQFFRPTIDKEHKNADDVEFDARYTRYGVDPPKEQPFFTHPSGQYFKFPLAAFERQLVDSKKPVALVFPFPHVTRFGDAGNANMIPTLRELIRCLWAEDAIAVRTRETPFLGSIAVGGFSNGGVAAQKAFDVPSNNSKIDELYLFDPAQMGKTDKIPSWLAAKRGTRKLRLLAGGYQQDFMNALARGLRDPANVSVQPADPDFWYSSDLYKKALSNPTTPGGIDVFDAPGVAANALHPASKRSGIRVVSFNHNPARPAATTLTLRADFSTDDKNDIKITGVSHTEAAALVAWWIIGKYNAGQPVRTVDQFKLVVKMISLNDAEDKEKNRIRALRHEWAIDGGEIDPSFKPVVAGTRTAAFPGFKGFLQICLEKSGFTA